MSGRNAYIGAGEVSALIGKWQQIVGGDWHQIVGADTQYNPYQGYNQGYNPYNQYNPYAPHPHHRHHRHHHRAAVAPAAPYGYPQYRPGTPAPYRAPGVAMPYHAPYAQPYAQPATVRDHRRRALAQMAYVRGDTAAVGALALMGAEDAAAAETGVPPVDATIPAPPLPPDPAADATADAIAPPPMDAGPPMDMAPPEHHRHHGHHGHHGHHRGNGGGGGYGPPPTAFLPPPPPQYGYPVTPRNMMVDYPPPSRADRVVLPMSSGVAILPNTSAQITSRPQNVAFRPERLIIGGTPGNWIVNDIKVGNRSQFSQSGDVPGEMFAATTIDSFVSFETVQTAMDFVVLVTNVGNSESGEQFVCGVLGTAAV